MSTLYYSHYSFPYYFIATIHCVTWKTSGTNLLTSYCNVLALFSLSQSTWSSYIYGFSTGLALFIFQPPGYMCHTLSWNISVTFLLFYSLSHQIVVIIPHKQTITFLLSLESSSYCDTIKVPLEMGPTWNTKMWYAHFWPKNQTKSSNFVLWLPPETKHISHFYSDNPMSVTTNLRNVSTSKSSPKGISAIGEITVKHFI